jgi:hypothetical protein
MLSGKISAKDFHDQSDVVEYEDSKLASKTPLGTNDFRTKEKSKDSSAKNNISSFDYSKKTETTAGAKNNRVANYDQYVAPIVIYMDNEVSKEDEKEMKATEVSVI